MKHRVALIIWLGAVIAATMVHAPAALGMALLVVLVGSGPGRLRLVRTAAFAVLPVLLLISAGYLLMGWLTGELQGIFLLRLNLRVLLLALMTAWMIRDVDLDRAFEGLPAARRWLAIVRGQVAVFRRLAAEHRAAVLSRSTVRPSLAQRYHAGAALGLAVLDKAVHNSEALVQGMRSRGALDD